MIRKIVKDATFEELSQEYNQNLKDKLVYKYRNIEALSKSDLLDEIERECEKVNFPFAKSVLVDIISGELENKYGVRIVDAKVAPEIDDYDDEDYIEITEEELNTDLSEEEKEAFEEEDDFSEEENESPFEVLDEDSNSIEVEIIPTPSKEEYMKFFEPYLKTKQYLNIKFGSHWITIYNATVGFDLECGEVWLWYKTFEETYDAIVNIDEKIKEADERQKEALDSTEKYHDELMERVNKANDEMGIKKFAELCSSIDVYSDVYKDAYGYRPREECHEMFNLLSQNAPKLNNEYIALSYDEKLKLLDSKPNFKKNKVAEKAFTKQIKQFKNKM